MTIKDTIAGITVHIFLLNIVSLLSTYKTKTCLDAIARLQDGLTPNTSATPVYCL